MHCPQVRPLQKHEDRVQCDDDKAVNYVHLEYFLPKILGSRSISDFGVFWIRGDVYRLYQLSVPNLKIQNMKSEMFQKSKTFEHQHNAQKIISWKILDFRFCVTGSQS
jgi:hypothetical protein